LLTQTLATFAQALPGVIDEPNLFTLRYRQTDQLRSILATWRTPRQAALHACGLLGNRQLQTLTLLIQGPGLTRLGHRSAQILRRYQGWLLLDLLGQVLQPGCQAAHFVFGNTPSINQLAILFVECLQQFALCQSAFNPGG
jgi:hypothetical protein